MAPQGISADGDVTIGEAEVPVGQDQVRVIVLQLPFILNRKKRQRLV